MSEHRATINWELKGSDFSYEAYNREHEWRFEDVRVPASAAPAFGGLPGHVDPEAALVAALSSCHMLTFLALCAREGHVVARYSDAAVGTLEKNAAGRLAVTRVELRPRIEFRGEPPDADALARLHDRAHRGCFIANSVTTDIVIRPLSTGET
ncbi:MAG: OsmC family protein [Gemmatimonadota bacterium]